MDDDLFSSTPRPAQVWNRHEWYPKGAIYVGRGTPWGNPFIVGVHGERGECVDLFEEHVLPTLDVSALRGKDLLCSCVPRRCHATSIFKKANA